MRNLLSSYVAILASQTSLVYAGIGEVAAQWNMIEDDVGGCGDRKAEQKSRSPHDS